MEKIITPHYTLRPTKNSVRKKLTGYIGELRDGETIISSMEYSTYADAEQALDALAFDILSDLAEQGLIDELPTFEPSTCVFCHKPHSPQSCSEMRALLFAPSYADELQRLERDAREQGEADAQCAYRGCIQNRTHDDTGFCCYHNEEETGCRCDCEDDDWADAAWESDQGTYNGKVPSDFAPIACPHGADCPWCARGIRVEDHTLMSAEYIRTVTPLDVDFAPSGPEV